MKDILTEKEAEERRCPYSFGPPFTSNGAKVSATGVSEAIQTSPTNCIASQCMAWRLAHKPAASGEETGFCGAFGVPRHT